MKAQNFCQILILLTISLCVINANAADEFLGRNRQQPANTSEFIYVHLVPHTHNDAGWLWTADSYFWGNSRGCVRCILDNIIFFLQRNSSRRFVYAEQLYFQEWWNIQNDDKKAIIKKLIENGQLEFVNGGYVMNDEACTYYDDIIEQMTLGHRFIKSEFNKTVNVGWHLDPFGHSAPQARLFSEMGFDSWFFERIDDPDFENRKKLGRLEMVWRPESHDKDNNFLLGHVNYMKYYLKPPFAPTIGVFHSGAGQEVAAKYADWIKELHAAYHGTQHVMHHVGGDFEWYTDAEDLFHQLENMIDFYDKNPQYGIKAQYSTPRLYTEAVYKELLQKNITLSEKNDDFFPYRDSPNAFWSGYYTSKPLLKKSTRDASKYLQSVKKVLSKLYITGRLKFADIGDSTKDFEAALSTLQHHDAVTGTAKRFVDEDYERILLQGYESIHKKLLPMLTRLFHDEYPRMRLQPFLYLPLNVSAVREAQSQAQNVVAYVYNPSQIQTRIIRFPVPSGSGTLKTNLGNTELDYGLICSNSRDKIDCEVCFMDQIGTNQFKSYTWSSESPSSSKSRVQSLSLGEDVDYRIHLFNGEMLDIATGYAADFIYTTSDGVAHPFSLNYGVYQSFQRKDSNKSEQRSGAYIFRPITQNSSKYGSIPTMVHITRCSQFVEVTLKRDPLVTTRLRFYNTTENGVSSPLSQTIEIETLLDELPVHDGVGKEVVLIISGTGIKNKGVFYTNSNGLENQKRIRNSVVHINESVSGNYYPVNSAIYIEDAETGARVTLMNDRSQGGSSLEDGSIEIMINRRCLEDDDRGVEEALNDTRPVQLTHWLTFSKGALKQRTLQYDIDTSPLIYLSTTSDLRGPRDFKSETQLIRKVDLVKFYIRIYNETEMVVRLHNLREDESVVVRGFVNKEQGVCQVLQEELLAREKVNVKITDVKEVTLSTVHEKHEMLKKKYRWNGIGEESLKSADHGSTQYENVVLRPLEERVFIFHYKIDD